MSIDRGLVKNGDHHIVEWSGYVQRDVEMLREWQEMKYWNTSWSTEI